MIHQEKMDFYHQLDLDGLQVVKRKCLDGNYAEEYKALAEEWIKHHETNIPLKTLKIHRWRLIVAITAIIVSLMVFYLTHNNKGETGNVPIEQHPDSGMPEGRKK